MFDRAARPPLFAYGTLQFPGVLAVILGRVPPLAPAEVAGWRVAALDGRSYPGLVPAAGVAAGVLVAGLSPAEWAAVDRFEDVGYDLLPVRTTGGARACAYVWRDPAAVLCRDWSSAAFAAEELGDYVDRCARWRRG